MSKLLDPFREMLNMRLHVAELTANIAELEAELATLRPWADIGKRAVREEWFFQTFDDDGWDITKCMVCNKVQQQWPGGHAPDCPIPALLKQLEADNAS